MLRPEQSEILGYVFVNLTLTGAGMAAMHAAQVVRRGTAAPAASDTKRKGDRWKPD